MTPRFAKGRVRLRALLGAFILVGIFLLGSRSASALTPPATAQTEHQPRNRWPIFRGNPQQTGVALSSLPDRLKTLWTFEAPEGIIGTAAILDGRVFAGCEDGFVYCLDLADGSLRWKYKTDEMIQSSPSVFDGTVFVGDDSGMLHAVDAANGKKRWTYQTEGQIISSVNREGNRIVFGAYDGFVYCLNISDGKLLWKFETAGRVHGTPGISKGYVLAAGCDEFLHVLRLTDGTSKTKVSMESVSGCSAAVYGSKVYVGTYGHRVLGIDWSTGVIDWTFEDPERDFPYMSSAAVTDELVIIGGRDKRVRALNRRTGKQRWEFVTKGRVDSSPVVVGKRVFFGSSDGFLYAVDIDTGKPTWRFETGAPLTASPAVASRRLVIGTVDGTLYCLGDK